jgi:hypothetical protein
MPDPKQMSGIPRPVDDLPAGSISVRLIRGSLTNNIVNHPVELRIGSRVVSANTDENGRAQFDKVPSGATVRAAADVDGEHLESQEFPAPAQGGIRLMLVATDKSKASAIEPAAPAAAGQVVISNQSRIVLEPAEDAVNVFYLLDISNTARGPVNPPAPFVFDVPKGALQPAIMEGSSPQASISNGRVRVEGPFAPGHTLAQIAFALPSDSGSVELAQPFPANVETLTVIARKLGDTTLTSPQISTQQDIPLNGELFVGATGGSVSAGQPIRLTLTRLPHHSIAPQVVTLALALAIILAAVWAWGRKTDESSSVDERKRLLARRDRLLNDLVRLESDRRSGRGAATDDHRYATRREELMSSLERIYGALDSDHTGPEPADRAGLAA